jgi:hypothetical protein
MKEDMKYKMIAQSITHKKWEKVLLADAENYYPSLCQKRSSKKLRRRVLSSW